MNTTNVVIGLGVGVFVLMSLRKRNVMPTGFNGLDPYAGGNTPTTTTPNYGNDNQGTFTDIEPVETPTQPRSVWTKDEGSWLWGWGPKKG